MEWTKEKPTEPGYYWLRRVGPDPTHAGVHPVYICLNLVGDEILKTHIWGDIDRTRYADAEWAGPIRKPTEPKP